MNSFLIGGYGEIEIRKCLDPSVSLFWSLAMIKIVFFAG